MQILWRVIYLGKIDKNHGNRPDFVSINVDCNRLVCTIYG